jgi:hypothetical protein
MAAKSLRLAEPLAAADDGIAWRGFPLGTARLLAMEIDAQGVRSAAAQAAALRPAPAEASRLATLLEKKPHDALLARTAAEAAILAGDEARLTGDAALARSWWTRGQAMLEAGGPRGPTDRAALLATQFSARLAPPPARTVRENAGTAELVDYKW